MKRAVIYGATSAIAEQVARRWAAAGDALVLIGRRADRLDALAADLRQRGARQVDCLAADLLDYSRHDELYRLACDRLGEVDVVLVAHGTLGDQAAGQRDAGLARREFESNLISVVSVLTPIANEMESRGHGVIAVISSVAGDRGRQSNYIYGATKGGLQVFLQGLRHRLAPRGVAVVDIRPGFIDTPMTAAIAKKPLVVKPEVAAAGIDRAIRRRCAVAYVPWFWRWIMLIIRLVPMFVFHRTKL
jgi:short-subunit dehydrogenase